MAQGGVHRESPANPFVHRESLSSRSPFVLRQSLEDSFKLVRIEPRRVLARGEQFREPEQEARDPSLAHIRLSPRGHRRPSSNAPSKQM